jgi:hypothetical protein
MKLKYVAAIVAIAPIGAFASAVGAANAPAPAPNAPAPSPAASAPVEHVSTTGTDSGNCISAPCATINYAISQAPSGQTIRVAAGTYNQTVNVSKPVKIMGAGASSTTIDGNGLDPSNDGYYGVVYVGATGGVSTVSGFTITNPYPDSYTGGEPEAVALADSTSSDSVNIVNNDIVEGSADTNTANDFPIGIDTFENTATTDISGNTVSGFFQGALLEDNGPVTLNRNTFSDEIASGGYQAEGVFFLSDLAGALTGQNASGNTFTGFNGYGIAMSAGYSNGNCTASPCDGSLTGTLSNNAFALTGGPSGAAITLLSQNTGNDLTATLSHNRGYVTAPSVSTQEQATGGGTLTVNESGDTIAVRAPTPGSASSANAPTHTLRVPTHH